MSRDRKLPIPGTGRFLGMPYDWRRTTWARIKERLWNPHDRRLVTPKGFGWGYDLNLYELLARVGIVRCR
ncbi:MAG: hypothetical protein KY456_17045 [Chloroflexi bacterium]|nr:hypothetical protein [Chloroflexota bacterium]